MRKNPSGWSIKQTNAMHWLQQSSLKSARAWRLKMALREVYARAAASNNPQLARTELNAWLSWASQKPAGAVQEAGPHDHRACQGRRAGNDR